MGSSTVRSVSTCVLACALVATLGAGQTPPAQPAPGGAPPRGAGAPPPPPPSPEAIARAESILAEARKALGGDKLAGVKTLVANGRTRRLRGNNIQPIEFEMSLELPDKYLRRDEFPAEESDPTSSGFNGSSLIQLPVPAAPPAAARPGGPPPPSPEQQAAQRAQRVNTVKQDFVRFALGMFPGSFDTYPLTFAFAAQAQAPQGRADVLDVRGAGNFTARLFISSETHLPIMLSWQLPPTNVIVLAPGQPQPATVAPGAVIVNGPASLPPTATQEQKDAYAKEVAAVRAKAQATPVEHRIYFADYRASDGVLFPFRLRRAIGADTTEETTFDRFRLNTNIDPRRFQVPQ